MEGREQSRGPLTTRILKQLTVKRFVPLRFHPLLFKCLELPIAGIDCPAPLRKYRKVIIPTRPSGWGAFTVPVNCEASKFAGAGGRPVDCDRKELMGLADAFAVLVRFGVRFRLLFFPFMRLLRRQPASGTRVRSGHVLVKLLFGQHSLTLRVLTQIRPLPMR